MKDNRAAQEIDRHLGCRIKAFRLSRKLSREALASLVGVSHQQIAKYESGGNRVSASMLVRLTKCLKTDAVELFGDFPGWSSASPETTALPIDDIYRIAKILDSLAQGHRAAIRDLIEAISTSYESQSGSI